MVITPADAWAQSLPIITGLTVQGEPEPEILYATTLAVLFTFYYMFTVEYQKETMTLQESVQKWLSFNLLKNTKQQWRIIVKSPTPDLQGSKAFWTSGLVLQSGLRWAFGLFTDQYASTNTILKTLRTPVYLVTWHLPQYPCLDYPRVFCFKAIAVSSILSSSVIQLFFYL